MSIKDRVEKGKVYTYIKEKFFKFRRAKPAEDQSLWYPGVPPVTDATVLWPEMGNEEQRQRPENIVNQAVNYTRQQNVINPSNLLSQPVQRLSDNVMQPIQRWSDKVKQPVQRWSDKIAQPIQTLSNQPALQNIASAAVTPLGQDEGWPRPPNAGWKINAMQPPDTSLPTDTTRIAQPATTNWRPGVMGAPQPTVLDSTFGPNTAWTGRPRQLNAGGQPNTYLSPPRNNGVQPKFAPAPPATTRPRRTSGTPPSVEAGAKTSTARVSPPPTTRNAATVNREPGSYDPNTPNAIVNRRMAVDELVANGNMPINVNNIEVNNRWSAREESSKPPTGANDDDFDPGGRRKSIPVFNQSDPIQFPFSENKDGMLYVDRSKLVHDNSRVAVLVANPDLYKIKIHSTKGTLVSDGTLRHPDPGVEFPADRQDGERQSALECKMECDAICKDICKEICEEVCKEICEGKSEDTERQCIRQEEEEEEKEVPPSEPEQTDSATICIPTSFGNVVKVEVHVAPEDSGSGKEDKGSVPDNLFCPPSQQPIQKQSTTQLSRCPKKPPVDSSQLSSSDDARPVQESRPLVGCVREAMNRKDSQEESEEVLHKSTFDLFLNRWPMSPEFDSDRNSKVDEKCRQIHQCEHLHSLDRSDDRDVATYYSAKLIHLKRLLAECSSDVSSSDNDDRPKENLSFTSVRCPFVAPANSRTAKTTNRKSICRLSDEALCCHQKALSSGHPCWADCFRVLIGRNLDSVSCGKTFLRLDVDAVCNLLRDDLLDVADERDVFRAVHRWLRCGEENSERAGHAAAVLRCVRFGLMSPADLVRCCFRSRCCRQLRMLSDEEAATYRSTLFAAFVWSSAVEAHLEGYFDDLEPHPRGKEAQRRSPNHEQTNAELDSLLQHPSSGSTTSEPKERQKSDDCDATASSSANNSTTSGNGSISSKRTADESSDKQQQKCPRSDKRSKFTKLMNRCRKCNVEHGATTQRHQSNSKMAKKLMQLFPPRRDSDRQLCRSTKPKPKPECDRNEDTSTEESTNRKTETTLSDESQASSPTNTEKRKDKCASSTPSNESLGNILDKILRQTGRENDRDVSEQQCHCEVDRCQNSPTGPQRDQRCSRHSPDRSTRYCTKRDQRILDESDSSNRESENMESQDASVSDERKMLEVLVRCPDGQSLNCRYRDVQPERNATHELERSSESRTTCQSGSEVGSPPASPGVQHDDQTTPQRRSEIQRSPACPRVLDDEQATCQRRSEGPPPPILCDKIHIDLAQKPAKKEETSAAGVTRLIYGLSPFAKCVVASEKKRLMPPLNPYPCCALLVLGGLNPVDSWDDEDVACGTLLLPVNGSDWEDAEPLPEPFMLASACLAPGYGLFVCGGVVPKECQGGRRLIPRGRSWRYDTRRRCWRRLADMSIARLHHAVTPLVYPADVMGGEEHVAVLAIGGQDRNLRCLSSVEIYDTDSEQWGVFLNLPAPRMAACAAYFNGAVWVCGGMRETGSGNSRDASTQNRSQTNFAPSMIILDEVVAFDPFHGVWAPRARLRVPRCLASLVACGKQLLIVGGATCPDDSDQTGNDAQQQPREVDGLLPSLDSIDEFVPEFGCWRHAQRMNKPRQGCVALACDGCLLLIIGGVNSKGLTPVCSVECYDTNQNSISPGPRLPWPLLGFTAVLMPPVSGGEGNVGRENE